MRIADDQLHTPIYLKTRDDMPWPEDKFFYLLSADGLFVCRNHEHFRSSVLARRYPGELAGQTAFLQLRYPRVPRRLLELAVGFFGHLAERHGAEAAVLLACDRADDSVHLLVPDQEARVQRTLWGNAYPIDLRYEQPRTIPRNWTLIGDIHSHVYSLAFSSYTDRNDEAHRAGLHIVVGCLDREPPDFHIEAAVDGVRFKVRPELVFEGYRRRSSRVPQEWLEKVRINAREPYYYRTYDSPKRDDAGAAWGQSSSSWGTSSTCGSRAPAAWDRERANGGSSAQASCHAEALDPDAPPAERPAAQPPVDIRQEDDTRFGQGGLK